MVTNMVFKKGCIPKNKGVPRSEETKQKISKGNKGKTLGRHHSQETKQKMSDAHKGKKFNQEQRRHMSEAKKGINNPMYGRHLSEGTKHKLSEIRKKIPRSKKWCENISKALTGNPNVGVCGRIGPLSPTWRGGKSFEPYCHLFNESFKEYIREKFNRKCYICGRDETDNGKHLSVHHIDYNKNSICNGKAWAFVPLCKTCHNYTIGNRYYWFNRLICYYIENKDINIYNYGIWCW